ncbi:hypothetical protein BOX15_Mlig024368g1, partial [Macrostomum lignano]
PATRSSMKVYCIACQKRCKGEVLRVQEKYMHRDCFKCAACSVGLEKGGFFVREAKFYCPDDYQKLFGVRCRICTEYVTGEVITALGSTFHPRCFKCQSCDSPFAPGDRVTQWSNQLYLCKACSQRTGRAASSVSNGNGHHQRALDSDSTVAGGASSSTPLSRAYPQHLAYQQHQHSPTSFSCPSESGLGDRGGGSSSIIGGSGSVVHRRFPSGFGSHLLARSYLSMEQETEQRTHPNDRYRRTTSPSVCGSVTGSGAPSPQHFHLPPSRVSRQASLASRSTHPGSVAAGGSGRRTPRSLSPSPGDDPLLLSLYPGGSKPDLSRPAPIERDNWPAPAFSSLLLAELGRRHRGDEDDSIDGSNGFHAQRETQELEQQQRRQQQQRPRRSKLEQELADGKIEVGGLGAALLLGNGAQDESDADSIRQQHRGSAPACRWPSTRPSGAATATAASPETPRSFSSGSSTASPPACRSNGTAERPAAWRTSWPPIRTFSDCGQRR